MSADPVADHLGTLSDLLGLMPTADIARHVERCEASIARAETVGCMFDPSAYLRAVEDGSLEAAHYRLAVARHLLAARRAIDRREEFVKAGQPGATT